MAGRGHDKTGPTKASDISERDAFLFSENDSTIGWGSENIVRMPGFQGFYLVRDGLVRTDENGLDEGWMFNGQKVLGQIICGVFASVVAMHELLGCLTA